MTQQHAAPPARLPSRQRRRRLATLALPGMLASADLTAAAPLASASQTTVTFSYTGTAQTFTVPADVTSITAHLSGAQGQDAPEGGGAGGLGGEATATLPVTPGQVLQVNVGGSSGFGGGGAAGTGGESITDGGGGGGATDIRTGPGLSDRLLVAGGGGGGGNWFEEGTAGDGGAGGGASGRDGSAGPLGANPGGGPSATAGGTGGAGTNGGTGGADGASGTGGDGGSAINGLGSGGGGGGGGWFGGGGAGGQGEDSGGNSATGGGGGGSGFGPVGTTFQTGVQSGDGTATITYIPNPAPAITGISPASGPLAGGTIVTITGTGFTGATAVDFGTTAATSFTVNSDTSITATAPTASAVGPVDVTVTTPAGTSTSRAADQYTYVFAFTGFQSPVDNPPALNQVNGGQSIPVKWSLGGNQGLGILAVGSPTATQVDRAFGAPVNTATLTDTVGGLQYDSATGTYTYVWKTLKAWSGTCQQFTLTLTDGTTHSAIFQFK